MVLSVIVFITSIIFNFIWTAFAYFYLSFIQRLLTEQPENKAKLLRLEDPLQRCDHLMKVCTDRDTRLKQLAEAIHGRVQENDVVVALNDWLIDVEFDLKRYNHWPQVARRLVGMSTMLSMTILWILKTQRELVVLSGLMGLVLFFVVSWIIRNAKSAESTFRQGVDVLVNVLVSVPRHPEMSSTSSRRSRRR